MARIAQKTDGRRWNDNLEQSSCSQPHLVVRSVRLRKGAVLLEMNQRRLLRAESNRNRDLDRADRKSRLQASWPHRLPLWRAGDDGGVGRSRPGRRAHPPRSRLDLDAMKPAAQYAFVDFEGEGLLLDLSSGSLFI